MRSILRRLARVARAALGRATSAAQPAPLDPIIVARLAADDRRLALARSKDAGRRAVELLSMIKIQDPVGGRFERIGALGDGGYVMETTTLRPGVAYSLGIGRDVSWDIQMAEREFDVFQYDHTVAAPPSSHPRFHFAPLKIVASGQSAAAGERSLDGLIEENGHAGRSDLVLKIDIEGDEWPVLASLPEGTLRQFSQVVIEFHQLWEVDRDDLFEKVRQVLQTLRADFVAIHVHGNNCCSFAVVGGISFPRVFEVTYLRRDILPTIPNTRSFPTELDYPNVRIWAELQLGRFEF